MNKYEVLPTDSDNIRMPNAVCNVYKVRQMKSVDETTHLITS